jgi:hypothetical protein
MCVKIPAFLTVTDAGSLPAKAKRRLSRVLRMSLTSTVLSTEATVYKHTKGNTLYVSIPSKLAQDSAFPIKEGDAVEIEWDQDLKAIVIKPKKISGKD